MPKIFITGSADGLGQMAAQWLADHNHEVLLHARHEARGKEAMRKIPKAIGVATGDLSDMEETKHLAEQVNAFGQFDAIIHNAGVYQASSPLIFTVNTIAPYLLTCLIKKPNRLIYMSSGMHRSGDGRLSHFDPDHTSYSDSKLHDLILTKVIADQWPEVYANAVDPGWVPTKMGGAGAPDNLEKGYQTQAWLAVSEDEKAKVTGRYFYHMQQQDHHQAASDIKIQEQFISLCKEYTGIALPD